ncbi:MAG: hypothetical protein R3E79_23985 [Caldilineaceae bacterium]
MNEQPPRHNQFDQSGQTVLGNQTNIGDVNTGGGDFVSGSKTEVHGDQNVYVTWPRVATSAALVALLAFTLLVIELATNAVGRLSGLSLQSLLIVAGLIAALPWGLALWMLWARPLDSKRRISRRNNPSSRQHRFTGRPRHLAKALAIGLPLLAIIISAAYYTWHVLPARYTTILLCLTSSPPPAATTPWSPKLWPPS